MRRWAGGEIATMFEVFENNTDCIDIKALHAEFPDVRWHSFETWAREVDGEHLLAQPRSW